MVTPTSTPADLLIDLQRQRDIMYVEGLLPSPADIDRQLAYFSRRFGPAALRSVDDTTLLRLMHGRGDAGSPCLVYTLEFQNDEHFNTNLYGGIGGGNVFKFGLNHKPDNDMWLRDSPQGVEPTSIREAASIATGQRDELLAGCDVLNAFSTRGDISDGAYQDLQQHMAEMCPKLFNIGWAHKYWSLLFPNLLDQYHSARHQRFHLFKLLQVPPDESGLRPIPSTRFNCAGRFVELSRQLSLAMPELSALLNRFNGPFRNIWRIGTTHGDTEVSVWDDMRRYGVMSVGWREEVSDLTDVVREKKASTLREVVRRMLSSASTASVASRKAGEITNFALGIAERDLIIACNGQRVLGIGEVVGPYEYDSRQQFPHTRRVNWLTTEVWTLPDQEGLQTTVYPFGKSWRNLVELNRRLLDNLPRKRQTQEPAPAAIAPAALPPLDPMTTRIDGILRRKGQVILYGPPGTGKTFHAWRAALELAARHHYGRSFGNLNEKDSATLRDGAHYVRICSFHPGWTYEDFVEGLRPTHDAGGMNFAPRDGLFKRLCTDAANEPGEHFYLVIDEINRANLPQVFGELFTAIEYDKRGTKISLPVTGAPFAIPRNVFILGTMNTADRSISIMDTALRRRFGFIELLPDSIVLQAEAVGDLPLAAWLEALNERLRRNLRRNARSLQVGHAYLLPVPASVAEFSRIVRDEIIPLLEEYCYDDFAMLRLILGDQIIDQEAGRIREELFLPEREAELISALRFEEMLKYAPDRLIGEETNDTVDVESDVADET